MREYWDTISGLLKVVDPEENMRKVVLKVGTETGEECLSEEMLCATSLQKGKWVQWPFWLSPLRLFDNGCLYYACCDRWMAWLGDTGQLPRRLLGTKCVCSEAMDP